MGVKQITNADMQEFCCQLKKAIENTTLEGKSDKEIFGEIYTRTRTEIWYRLQDSKLKDLFAQNMKEAAFKTPKSIKAIIEYVTRQVLNDRLPKNELGDMQLAIASMSRLSDEMSDVAKLSGALCKQLTEIKKTLDQMENGYVESGCESRTF